MDRFLIAVPHEADKKECLLAAQTFLMTGSHFLENADWGCSDDVHKAWTIVEVETKEDARSIIPPSYRPQAEIVRLRKYTMKDVDEMLRQHRS